MGKVLQTAESHDPYNDDFYYIQVIFSNGINVC